MRVVLPPWYYNLEIAGNALRSIDLIDNALLRRGINFDVSEVLKLLDDKQPLLERNAPELFSVKNLEELREYFLEHRIQKALLGSPYEKDCLKAVSDKGLEALQTIFKRYPEYVPDALRDGLRTDVERETELRAEKDSSHTARREKADLDYEIDRQEPAHYSWNFHSKDWRVPSGFNETTTHLKTSKAFDLS